jgi:4-hydroxy-2-oxoheptanedioate aldolase
MKLPKNKFKAAIKAGRQQIGMWNSLPGCAELLGHMGFDWVLVDCEHAPQDVLDVLPALQSLEAAGTQAVVRPVENDVALIKRYLDLGAQTLLIPQVQTPEEAARAVAATRYAPRGIRGMAGMTRATRYNTVENYFTSCEDELCLLLQVETIEAMEHLDEIALTDGVDGIFIGPADLSASMGYPGQGSHPDVVAVIDKAISRLNALGVPAGILSLQDDEIRHYIDQGTVFTAVGLDTRTLAQGAKSLATRFCPG